MFRAKVAYRNGTMVDGLLKTFVTIIERETKEDLVKAVSSIDGVISVEWD